MSGELQTIPARHGVATFVPRGRTIKVINTYGKQVVSMWAFTLGAPPDDEDEKGEGEGKEKEMDEEQVKKEVEEMKKAVEEGEGQQAKTLGKDEGQKSQKEEGSGQKETQSTDDKPDDSRQQEGGGEESQSTEEADESKQEDGGKKESQYPEKETEDSKEEDNDKEAQSTKEKAEDSKEDAAEDPPEQAPDTPQNEETKEDTASSSKQPSKRTWASYLPSIPYRNKGTTNKPEEEQKPSAEQEKKKEDENTKKWSSYLPTGKSFSSYVPSVEVPDSKSMVSAFKSSHHRDPNKSYAEQLYDFSKTPVGAGSIAAATGSGYASSVYAAYNAYAMSHPSNASLPPMEYLSLPHTRAASHKLTPEVDDELLTNLRNPIITMIEDTSPGAHDTLTAACDANLYAALGVDKPAEHGSCAENLVLALNEINETAGLRGAKAVGADISVNIAPTPLHLFMNAPLKAECTKQDDGAGTKAVTIRVDEPQGKKRCFVRFRAERDVVIVFSACPMDVGKQNGGRCMAANFMVEDVQEGEDLASSVSAGKAKKTPKKLDQKGKTGEKKETSKKDEGSQEKAELEKTQSTKQEPKGDDDEEKKLPQEEAPGKEVKKDESKEKKDSSTAEEPKPKKKPKKLQVRSQGSSTPAKSSS